MAKGEKLTPPIAALLCQLVRDGGVPLSIAAARAGLRAATVEQWYQRGLGMHPEYDRREPYISFARAMQEAESEGHIAASARIRRCAMGGFTYDAERREREVYETITLADGTEAQRLVKREVFKVRRIEPPNAQCDMWWLERRYPEQWGRKAEVDNSVTNILARIVQVPQQYATNAEFEKAALDYAKQLPPPEGGNGSNGASGNGSGNGQAH